MMRASPGSCCMLETMTHGPLSCGMCRAIKKGSHRQQSDKRRFLHGIDETKIYQLHLLYVPIRIKYILD